MDRKRIADLWGGELEIECTTIPEQKDLTVTDSNRSGVFEKRWAAFAG